MYNEWDRSFPAISKRHYEPSLDIQLHSFAGRKIARNTARQSAGYCLLFKFVVLVDGDFRLRTPRLPNLDTPLSDYKGMQE